MESVSVIIPTLNEEKYIPKLLADLTNQAHPLPVQIIVVDGNSTDNTLKEIKKFPTVKVIQTKRGVGHQRTRGGKTATGDILIFLDADTRVPERFIHHIAHRFEKKDIALACPFYAPHRSTLPINIVYWFFNTIFSLSQKITPSGAGSCIIVKKDIFEKYNGFKDHLTYDDIEFIRRVAKKEKFAIIPRKLYVSDRRFRKFGVTRMFMLYLLLSFFFTLGLFKQANRIRYTFGLFN
jgi:glycosyltransferase involved in cell wall biosynthesis